MFILRTFTWFGLCTLVFNSKQSLSLTDRREADVSAIPGTETVIELFMPKVNPDKSDAYLCTSKSVASMGTQYIHKFVPNAEATRAHHMILFACDNVEEDLLRQGHWDCAHHYSACKNMRIIYAWAKNAPATILPKDVGFRIGTESNISYLVLQVHYAHPVPEGTDDESGFKVVVSNEEPKYLAGMLLLVAGALEIPAHTEKTHADMNCVLRANSPVVPFAFRVHTHKWGSVVSGYHVNFGEVKFNEIAKGNPQWPQAFYPMKTKTIIKPKDLVAARCTYNTTNNDHPTGIGMTAGDEMCNLYIMFYTESRDPEEHSIQCYNEEFKAVNRALPLDSDVPLPRNKTLEEYATGGGHGNTPKPSGNESDKRISHARKRPGIEPYELQEQFPQYVTPAPEFFDGGDNTLDDRADRQLVSGLEYNVVENWPRPEVKLGQASGTDFDLEGNVVVFHRADRVWDANTFDVWNRYREEAKGPIGSDTVFVIHPTTGAVLHQWGKDMFYMPHDIAIAPNGDTFLTDVALHQVFKFEPGQSHPSLTLGEAFKPGRDDNHFCKPAAVAVMKSGDFFVADGYCNSRIVKFDKVGRKLSEWGRPYEPNLLQRLTMTSPPPYTFTIPHALALAEDQDLLCVADRENGRIQCFSASEGKFKFQIKAQAFAGRLFSVAYSALNGGTLFAVNGEQQVGKVQGFVIPLSTKRISSVFSPMNKGFGQPHDIAVNKNGSEVIVVEISQPYLVWKFERKSNQRFGKGDKQDPLSLPITSVTAATGSKSKTVPHSQSADDFEDNTIGSSVMIMAFLTIPLLFLIGVGALLRLRSSSCCKKRKDTKSFAEFFPPSAGFEKLKMEEDSDSASDTEVEEFSKPGFRRSLRI